MLDAKKKEIILTLAECNMNVTEVSRRKYFHRNTVEYHCKQIRKKTGLNPQNFYDLVKLVEMAQGGDDNG